MDEVLDHMGCESEFDLLGLFTGRGLAQGGAQTFTGQMPNMVWLYRRPILDYWAEGEDTLGDVIAHVSGARDRPPFRPFGRRYGGNRGTALTKALHRPIERADFGALKNMEKFTSLTGVAAPLAIRNVDTDMIIPKQYLKTIKRTGLGKGLFSEMRYKEDGSREPRFRSQQAGLSHAQILVAEDNFGCGSSREHAPWALLDFGIRCVISTSFADIFYNNCFKNGILPIVVSPEEFAKLMDDASRGSNATLSVDLEAQEIRGPDGGVDPFRHRSVPQALPAQRPRRHRPQPEKADEIALSRRRNTPNSPGCEIRKSRGKLDGGAGFP